MEVVTELVLSRAVADAAGWYAAGIHVPVAVDLSGPSFDDDSRPDRIMSVLASNGMRPACGDDVSPGTTDRRDQTRPEFVAPILHDPRAAAIVQSVIELAETCGISSVAEGVEDMATADRLKEYGCGYVQGHYFSPPVPAEAVRLGVRGSALVDARITRAATTPPSSA